MSHSELCPVCEGSGKCNKKECHGCEGYGWITIGTDYPAIPVQPYTPWQTPWEPYKGPFWEIPKISYGTTTISGSTGNIGADNATITNHDYPYTLT